MSLMHSHYSIQAHKFDFRLCPNQVLNKKNLGRVENICKEIRRTKVVSISMQQLSLVYLCVIQKSKGSNVMTV